MRSALWRPIFTGVSSLSRPNKVSSQSFSITMVRSDPFQPAKRVAGQKQDVWYVYEFIIEICSEWKINVLLFIKNPRVYLTRVGHLKIMLIRFRRTIVNEAATASPVQPIINMGQGFL